MASFHVFVLALLAVSAFGYDVNTRQYFPWQFQQYPTQSSLKSYPSYSYPLNYFLRQSYYNPYNYQQNYIRKEVVPVYDQQIYSPAYPYQKSSSQIPFVGYTQQDAMPIEYYQTKEVPQTVAGQVRYPSIYQTREDTPAVVGQVPVVGYQQENFQKQGQVYPAIYQQTRDFPQRVFYPYQGEQIRENIIQREQEVPVGQENVYPFQTQEGFQRVGYPEDYIYGRYFSDVYAPRYSELYSKYQELSKKMRPSKYEKRDSKHSKEEKREEDFEKNGINFERY